MADIKITLDADYGASLSNIQKAVKSIVSSINGNPPKIKVTLDTNSARTELAKLQNQIKALGKQKIKVQVAPTTTQAKGGSASATGAAQGAQKNAPGLKTLKTDTVAYNKALKSVNDMLVQVNNNREKWTAAQHGTSSAEYAQYTKQISELEALKTQLETGTMKVQDFNLAMSSIKATASDAAKSINFADENAKAIENLTSGTKEYSDALTQVSNLMRQVDTNKQNWTAASVGSTSTEYQTLIDQLTKLKDLSTDVQNGSVSLDQFKNRFSEIKNAVTEASNAIKMAGKDTILMTQGTEAQADALSKIATAKLDIQTKLNEWTAAEKGSSSGAYQELQQASDALDQLESNVKSGTMGVKEFNSEFKNIQSTANTASAAIKSAGEDTLSFGDRLKGIVSLAAKVVSVTRIVMAAIQTAKKMVSASIEIESAMARIQIVTGSSDAQMEQFFATATAHAKELGQSITDIAGSIETFSRLGYGLQDASDLAKYATIMSNVGDVSVDQATTGITSIIKGYNMDVSQAEHVTDVLVDVGQKYAISAEELMEAFERGGASMAASNTSFEKSAALFAATNASLELWRAA